MSQVIAIVNQKGGVAKTTTTVNLAAALSEHGEKVLCIDLDPQANLTMSLGCQTPDELPYTMAEVIDQEIAENPLDPMQGVIHHPEGIDLMPSSIQLSGYETVLINEYGRENMPYSLMSTVSYPESWIRNRAHQRIRQREYASPVCGRRKALLRPHPH